MSIQMILILAVGLSMDAFAVSVGNGMCGSQYTGNRKNSGAGRMRGSQSELYRTVVPALVFGIFQGVMPLLGYCGGRMAEKLITAVDHWIALVLLCLIGGSMIWESISESREGNRASSGDDPFHFGNVLVQGVATSIDALAVGVSLAALGAGIVTASLIIALVTFLVCLAGYTLGKRFGLLLGRNAKICGGVLLIGIGLRIFTSHMME